LTLIDLSYSKAIPHPRFLLCRGILIKSNMAGQVLERIASLEISFESHVSVRKSNFIFLYRINSAVTYEALLHRERTLRGEQLIEVKKMIR
jgi:hypothetical protein